jgi:hypothetical protein
MKDIKRWMVAVMEFDNWACQNCGTTKNLDAAHIEGRNVRPDLKFDPSNGVTLCRHCHGFFHQNPILFKIFTANYRSGSHMMVES